MSHFDRPWHVLSRRYHKIGKILNFKPLLQIRDPHFHFEQIFMTSATIVIRDFKRPFSVVLEPAEGTVLCVLLILLLLRWGLTARPFVLFCWRISSENWPIYITTSASTKFLNAWSRQIQFSHLPNRSRFLDFRNRLLRCTNWPPWPLEIRRI